MKTRFEFLWGLLALVVATAGLATLSADTAVAAEPNRSDVPFTDVNPSSFARQDIARLYRMSITTGTGATTYGPRQVVTREQMAAFLSRLFESTTGTTCPTPSTPFTDVDPQSFAAGAIACIHGQGITTGTTPTTFSPGDVVTREQMAAFLTRLFESITGTTCPTPSTPFTDVDPQSFAAGAIACIQGQGITTGTTPTTFSPGDVVTREQMAAFLIRLHDATILTTYHDLDRDGAADRLHPLRPPASHLLIDNCPIDANPLQEDADGDGFGDACDDGGAAAPCCTEGNLRLAMRTRPESNTWTSGDYWPWINARYDRMIVFEPYWDSRLTSFDQTYVYRNAYGMSVNNPEDTRAVEHPEWILADAAGKPAYIPFDCGNGCVRYAADVGNAQYRADFIAHLQDLAGRGYQGIFLDDVNLEWRFGDRNGAAITPIDPRTGAALTLADWQRYMVEFLEQIRAALPGIEIVHNAIWYVDSPTFDSPLVDRQIRAADVIQLQRGANDRGLTGGAGRFGLETFLAASDRIHALGTDVLFTDETATNPAEQTFNLAGALLISNGRDLVSSTNLDMIGPTAFWEGFSADLGSARGARVSVYGILRREFSGGLVLLNPPGRSQVTLTLEQPMRTLDGKVVDSVTLGPRQAAVLAYR